MILIGFILVMSSPMLCCVLSTEPQDECIFCILFIGNTDADADDEETSDKNPCNLSICQFSSTSFSSSSSSSFDMSLEF